MNSEVSFGQIVRERRGALGLTQSELARRAGCAPVTIRKIEGDGLRPSVQLAELLALALKIPKAFMGYEADIEGKATLAAEDIRFARTIERIQRILTSELYKIALVHLYTQGYDGEDLINFDDFNFREIELEKLFETLKKHLNN